jgi:4,5-DOPA dioxygenase extradiol
MLPLVEAPASEFLAGLGDTVTERYGRPKAILVASAHWETAVPTVNAVAVNETIHDFSGFPRPLYDLRYHAPGAPMVAEHVHDLLAAAGLECRIDRRRGLDHGAWCPLILAWPDADIPVLQVSLQTPLGPEHHARLGAALRPLRAEGVLVIGSGSWTHDLRRFRGQPIDAPETPDVVAFSDWMDLAVRERRRADLLAYRALAPFAAEQHPTEEHLLPLFVALGAGGEAMQAERLHSSSTFGMLRMDAYAFH